jgi:predicted acyltransferase
VETSKFERVASIDALRGFDMLWIMGGEQIIHALKDYTGWGIFVWLSNQLTHVEWNGFHFYDLVFPLFLFLSGTAMPYSIKIQLDKGVPKRQIYKKVLVRTLMLIFIGVIYNGLGDWKLSNLRYASVLGQIGIAYFFAAIIYLNTNWKQQIYWIAGILIGYWGIQTLIPFHGSEAGRFTMEGSINAFIDQIFMPGKLYLGIHDPEGLLVKIPATATALLGALAGSFIRDGKFTQVKKAGYLLGAGLLFLLLANLWNIILPINKNLWTSSFVFQTAGWSLIFLSIFYYFIDAAGYKKYAFFFIVIGMNPITIYLASSFIDFGYTINFVFGGFIAFFSIGLQPVLFGFFLVLIKWVALHFMYKRKIFLKL